MRQTLALIFAASLAACSAPQSEAPVDENTVEEEAAAEAPPGTDIYLYALSWEGNTPSLGAAAGRIGHEGYDNQPFFTADGGVLYTSAGETGETDIWRYDLASGESTQLTDTPDASEYSPKIPPSEAALSYIYQPPGGYAGNAYLADEGNANPRAAHTLAPVGYYEFSGDMSRVAVFFLGDPESEGPFTLQLIDRTTTPETVTQIAENPGRTFWRDPRGRGVYHSVADADGNHTIQFLNYRTGRVRAMQALPDGVQDFVSHGRPDDTVAFFSTQDGSLVYWSGEAWTPIADLSALTGITRLAVSPDGAMIAIVAEES